MATVQSKWGTARDLTPEDRQRLNGQVAQILQKGSSSREALLRDIRELVAVRAAPVPASGA